MPDVSTRYVTWVSRRRRQHGATAIDIVTPTSTTATDPGEYGAFAPPQVGWTDPAGLHQAGFAFWSVTGARDGAFVTANSRLSVPIGHSNVSATAWYLPVGGTNGPGPAGVYIDAFDMNAGDFVDDDFVSIAPDSGLSPAANEDGFVPTSSLEHVNAFASVHTVPFVDWKLFAGQEPISGVDLTAGAGSNAVAFAFYASPPRAAFPVAVPLREGTWVSWGVMVDGGGPTGRGPVPPLGPLLRQFALGLAMADAAALAHPELRARAMDLAKEQVEVATKMITAAMLKSKG